MISKRASERLAFALMAAAAIAIVAPVLFVVVFVLAQGLPGLSWEFLTEMPRRGMKAGGIFPAIYGTVLLIVGTAVFSVPIGVGAAVYLSEYAQDNRFTRLVRIAIVNLAGVPSVVYGLFGLGIFVIFLGFGASILAGSLTLAILITPVIITASEEAIRAVPQDFRQASLALGATKWQTVRHQVIPYALPGIITGIVLGLGRAAGETAPILFTAAAFFLPRLPTSPFDQVMALPYHLFVITTQVPNMPPRIQYGTALVLLALVLSSYVIATLIRARLRVMR
ncbi:MAG: phosphate ABC transporter permease PstA [Chloroflexi bacterium]|nr:phosphate ABC transporter permease PstA [Chloroflexota bacterium]